MTARTVLCLLGLAFAVLALALWHLRDFQVYLPILWPPLMGLVAVGCWGLAAFPSRTLYRVVGSLAVGVMVGRVAGIISNAIYGPYIPAWQSVLATVVWLIAAWGVHVAWRHEVEHILHERKKVPCG